MLENKTLMGNNTAKGDLVARFGILSTSAAD
jgi:hypothetical protein